MKVRFRVRGETRTEDGPPGATVAQAASASGIHLNTACGGRGVCGRCAVMLAGGRFDVHGQPANVGESDTPVRALACQTRLVGGDALVEVPDASLIETQGQIADDFVLPPFEWTPVQQRAAIHVKPRDWESSTSDVERLTDALRSAGGPSDGGIELPVARAVSATLTKSDRLDVSWGGFNGGVDITRATPAGRAKHLGLAIDIGTTTVVAMLIDLDTGTPLARASAYNAQLRKGDDVAARIATCGTAADVEALQSLIVHATVNPLIKTACAQAACDPDDIVRVAAAGNTVMEHLFLGLNPSGIGALPFHPVRRRHPACRAREIGLAVHPNAPVDVLPSMTGHVGGDLVADATAARLLDRSGLVLLVDIGTNGEILLWDGRALLCTATAAGPAFEGAGIQCGMRASDGAIDHLRWDPGARPEWTTIGGGRPSGLCGSAAIDFIAEARAIGLLNEVGRLDMDRLRGAGLAGRAVFRTRPSDACVVAPAMATATGAAITVSEADIAELLKAKAAIHAGIVTLLAVVDRTPADVDTLILAGGFARHIHLRRATAMGLLPDLDPGRIEVIGNGSLAGALLALGGPGARETFDRLVGIARPVELNLQPDFESNYIDSLLLA